MTPLFDRSFAHGMIRSTVAKKVGVGEPLKKRAATRIKSTRRPWLGSWFKRRNHSISFNLTNGALPSMTNRKLVEAPGAIGG